MDGENIYVEIPDFPDLPFRAETTWVDESLPHDAGNLKEVKWVQLAHSRGMLKSMENHLKLLKDANGNSVTKGQDALGVYYLLGGDTLRPNLRERLTFKGIKVMGRASVDFKPMFGLENALGAPDLKLFGEVAVLGIENQGYYYDDVTTRIPIMLGVNLPTFRMLDFLSFQVEYYKNPGLTASKQLSNKPIRNGASNMISGATPRLSRRPSRRDIQRGRLEMVGKCLAHPDAGPEAAIADCQRPFPAARPVHAAELCAPHAQERPLVLCVPAPVGHLTCNHRRRT